MNSATVVIIRGKKVFASDGDIDRVKIAQMLERGVQLLTGQTDACAGLSRFFSQNDRIGIKINTIAGRMLTTRPEVSLSLAALLTQCGIPEKNFIIWDRTNRELKDAGYRLSRSTSGLKIFGTDSDGAGYENELISHLNIGSLFSSIQTNFVTASISLAVLKDHGLAGVTAGMKNYFGTIHNPNKYHDANCNPFIAELFDTKQIKSKHRLSILDGLVIQYHRGPSFHPQWTEKYGALIFSRDAVAADWAGWKLVERLRSQKGLPSLKEEEREPFYLRTAEKMGLGAAREDGIQLIEDEV